MPRRKSFGTLSERKQRRLSAKGGRTAHAIGVAHEWTSEEASRASLKRTPHAGLPSRKVGTRYEYFVVMHGVGKWLSRQRVSQLRKEHKL